MSSYDSCLKNCPNLERIFFALKEIAAQKSMKLGATTWPIVLELVSYPEWELMWIIAFYKLYFYLNYQILCEVHRSRRFQRHFDTLKQMFTKFQRPADFDPRLNNVKRTLSDIEGRCHLLDVLCDDPETLANQLNHCKVRTANRIVPHRPMCLSDW